MTISQTAREHVAGTLAHLDATRPGESSGNMQNDASGRNMTRPRRMIAVTVCLSEPLGAAPLDWADVIASNLRLLYGQSSVEIIDTWRADQ